MGLTVALETEFGKQLDTVGDPKNVLHRVLPSADDRRSQCLRYIDWYGNAMFNYLQMEQFLIEWRRLYGAAVNEEEKELLRQIEGLAVRCQKDRHVYLKFYGD